MLLLLLEAPRGENYYFMYKCIIQEVSKYKEEKFYKREGCLAGGGRR